MVERPSRVRRRPVTPNTDLVRVVLGRLAAAGEGWAPRFLGVDEGEEHLSWLPGAVRDDWGDRPDRLDALARVVRRFHDLTVDVVPDAACLVHDDLQPRNVVVDDEEALGVIDWEQLRPGRRVDDVAQLCWSFSPPDAADVRAVGRRWRRVLDAYGLDDRVGIVPASLMKIEHCVDDIVRLAANGSPRHIGFQTRGDQIALSATHAWLLRNEDALTAELTSVAARRSTRRT